MFCKNCGNQLNDAAKFCDKCGMPTSGEDHRVAQQVQNGNRGSSQKGFKETIIDLIGKTSDIIYPLMDKVLAMGSNGILMLVGILLGISVLSTIVISLIGSVFGGAKILVMGIFGALISIGVTYLITRLLLKFVLDKFGATYQLEELRVGTLFVIIFETVLGWIFGGGVNLSSAMYSANAGALARMFTGNFFFGVIKTLILAFFVSSVFFTNLQKDDDALTFGVWFWGVRLALSVVLSIILFIFTLLLGALFFRAMFS